MKRILRIVAALVIAVGLVFFLQGLNLLPGSFMSGNPAWARNGIILMAVGVGLLIWTHRA